MLDRKIYDKRYHFNHKEERNKYSKQYYLNHKEEINEKHKQYYIDNPEYSKQHYQDHKDEIKQYSKQYRLNHPKEIREFQRKYRQDPKGKIIRQRSQIKRQTRFKEIINTLTFQEWLDILEEYNYRCTYCNKEFTCESLPEKDHIIPISKGGNNTKENIVPACRSCNAKKYNKIIKENEVVIC